MENARLHAEGIIAIPRCADKRIGNDAFLVRSSIMGMLANTEVSNRVYFELRSFLSCILSCVLLLWYYPNIVML